MKIILILAITLNSLNIFSQTSDEHLQNGISKHNQQDFKGAIEDYNLAIDADKSNRDAYYNRGACELALKDLNSAMNDFSKTIELDSKFVRAYYSRATVFVSQEKYLEALADIDKTIELDETTPNALTLRGQLRVQTGNRIGACEDFNKAKIIGDKKADKYINKYCINEQKEGESLMLDWPDSENWKVGDDQENSQVRIIDLIHSNETIDNWTELGNMTSIKGLTGVSMDEAMNMMFEEAKKYSDDTKLTFIEKDESVKYPWIIFTIESPSFKNNEKSESQLWYIIQGEQTLYTNFRALKQATIPNELKLKWIQFFKTAKIVYK